MAKSALPQGEQFPRGAPAKKPGWSKGPKSLAFSDLENLKISELPNSEISFPISRLLKRGFYIYEEGNYPSGE